MVNGRNRLEDFQRRQDGLGHILGIMKWQFVDPDIAPGCRPDEEVIPHRAVELHKAPAVDWLLEARWHGYIPDIDIEMLRNVMQGYFPSR